MTSKIRKIGKRKVVKSTMLSPDGKVWKVFTASQLMNLEWGMMGVPDSVREIWFYDLSKSHSTCSIKRLKYRLMKIFDLIDVYPNLVVVKLHSRFLTDLTPEEVWEILVFIERSKWESKIMIV